MSSQFRTSGYVQPIGGTGMGLENRRMERLGSHSLPAFLWLYSGYILLRQHFSTSVRLVFEAEQLSVKEGRLVLCIVGYFKALLASTHCVPVAHSPGCDRNVTKNVLWGNTANFS